MIRGITITDPNLLKRVGRPEVLFEPGLNFLCGPNGAGKSSLIAAIARQIIAARHNSAPCAILDADPGPVIFHDAGEKAASPKVGDEDYNPDHSRLSRGQRLRTYINQIDQLSPQEPHVFLMDEPETSLDFDELVTLRNRLAGLRRHHQVIVATHSSVLLMLNGTSHIVLGTDTTYVKRLLSSWRHALCGAN